MDTKVLCYSQPFTPVLLQKREIWVLETNKKDKAKKSAKAQPNQ